MADDSRRVQLFATCLVEAIRPEAGLAVVTVLERLGYAVEYPELQTCCGQPAFNGGAWGDARPMARHIIDVLSRSEAPVVVPSGSCGDMIIHHYPELMAGDPIYGPKAQALAARTYEFTQFLEQVVGTTAIGGRCTGSVTYHASCHGLRGLNNRTAPGQLLSQVAEVDLRPLEGAEECCGFGGLFAVKMADLSSAMLARKLDHIAATGAGTVTGCDISCLMHIVGGARKRGQRLEMKHIAEILGE